jgi:ssDNA-binding Zn-finger/Zn-ribbon topoisomerase 1
MAMELRTPVEYELTCPECGDQMELRNSSRFGRFYGCKSYPHCKATHGAHKDGTPLGIPTTKEGKKARMRAHEVFDKLWVDRHMTRTEAYAWMGKILDLPPHEAHIARFDIAQCEKLIEAVTRFLDP